MTIQKSAILEGSESKTTIFINSNCTVGIVCNAAEGSKEICEGLKEIVKFRQGQTLLEIENPSLENRKNLIQGFLDSLAELKQVTRISYSFRLVLVLKKHYLIFFLGNCSLYLKQSDLLLPIANNFKKIEPYEIGYLDNIPISHEDRIFMGSPGLEQELGGIKLKALLDIKNIKEIPVQLPSLLRKMDPKELSMGIFEPIQNQKDLPTYAGWSLVDRFSVLKSADYFSQLTHDELLELVSIHKTKQIDDNTKFITQGDENYDLYFILDGSCKITQKKGNQQRLIRTLGKGSVIGELGALGRMPRSANATSLGLTFLMIIENYKLMNLLERNLSIKAKVYEAGFKLTMNRLKEKELQLEVFESKKNS